ncbi:hypothetical protein MSZK_01750 [Mycobacterium sp. shizuoka-1]|nr:hypothetical protein MSZK_01750 [Mycobacterium sp. shizuoka-1]
MARKGEAPRRQIATHFGILEACLHRWLKIGDREDGRDQPASPADAGDMAAQLRKAHKRIKSVSHHPGSIRPCPWISAQNECDKSGA